MSKNKKKIKNLTKIFRSDDEKLVSNSITKSIFDELGKENNKFKKVKNLEDKLNILTQDPKSIDQYEKILVKKVQKVFQDKVTNELSVFWKAINPEFLVPQANQTYTEISALFANAAGSIFLNQFANDELRDALGFKKIPVIAQIHNGAFINLRLAIHSKDGTPIILYSDLINEVQNILGIFRAGKVAAPNTIADYFNKYSANNPKGDRAKPEQGLNANLLFKSIKEENSEIISLDIFNKGIASINYLINQLNKKIPDQR
jgi:hypothetical protein